MSCYILQIRLLCTCEWIVSPLVLFCAHAKVKELLFHPIKSSFFCFPPLKGSCNSTRGRGGRSIEDDERPRSRNQTVCSLEYYLTVAVFSPFGLLLKTWLHFVTLWQKTTNCNGGVSILTSYSGLHTDLEQRFNLHSCTSRNIIMYNS